MTRSLPASRPHAVDATALNVAFSDLVVLRDFSLSVDTGEVLVLVGPSGCGKSTFLDCLAGVRAPDTGVVSRNVPSARTGYLLQTDSLLPWRSLLRNATLGAEVLGFPAAESEALLLMERLGLPGGGHQMPSEASGGMRQRTALVRTLLNRPELLIMDEPFAHIDLPRKLSIQKWLGESVHTTGATMIIVTHDLEDAISLADRILVVKGPPLAITATLNVAELRGQLDPISLRSHPAFGKLFGALWKEVDGRVS